MKTVIQGFHLPRYQDLPNMGLYLEQTTKYINHFLAPLGCIEITSSMISNYVKKGLLPSPVKKQYYADQLAYLFFISLAKQVLSMENIIALIERQRKTYTIPVAYDYFCMELENMLYFVFGLTDTVEDVGVTQTHEKNMLRSLIVAAAQIIYLDRCLAAPEAE
jgi:DNA-binding transcriptional MerR regulator